MSPRRGVTSPCPDCTCPAAAELEQVIERDRQWFRDHPAATQYRRPVTRAESTELGMTGGRPPGAQAAGRVTVTLVPGVGRARSFDGVYCALLAGADS